MISSVFIKKSSGVVYILLSMALWIALSDGKAKTTPRTCNMLGCIDGLADMVMYLQNGELVPKLSNFHEQRITLKI